MDQYTINIKQAAALLGVSPPTLRRIDKNGDPHFYAPNTKKTSKGGGKK